jgi:hypothetical protein
MPRVVDKCTYCGNQIEIEGGLVFEGPITEFKDYVEQKIKEASDKCNCRDTAPEVTNNAHQQAIPDAVGE